MDNVDCNKSGHELFGGWASLLEDVPEFDMLLNDKLKVSDCYTLAWMPIIECHYGGTSFWMQSLKLFLVWVSLLLVDMGIHYNNGYS